MKTIEGKLCRLLMPVLLVSVLTACDNDDDDDGPTAPPVPPAMASFDVTVSNLSNAQPLSPIAVIAHEPGYAIFTLGSAASLGLETLAEGGDNSMLIAEADSDLAVKRTSSGSAPIGPAGSETISFSVLESDRPELLLSVTTMLVNTNDAITGVNNMAIGDLQPGESLSWRTVAYDSGTEANTEQALHIPGPAGGGEGFNSARDDLADRVAMHTGVVSQDDGFASSDLSGQHRFDNPVAMIRIERIN